MDEGSADEYGEEEFALAFARIECHYFVHGSLSHTDTHSLSHTHTHTYTLTHTHTHSYTHIHAHTLSRTQLHTHTHAHTSMYSLFLSLSPFISLTLSHLLISLQICLVASLKRKTNSSVTPTRSNTSPQQLYFPSLSFVILLMHTHTITHTHNYPHLHKHFFSSSLSLSLSYTLTHTHILSLIPPHTHSLTSRSLARCTAVMIWYVPYKMPGIS